MRRRNPKKPWLILAALAGGSAVVTSLGLWLWSRRQKDLGLEGSPFPIGPGPKTKIVVSTTPSQKPKATALDTSDTPTDPSDAPWMPTSKPATTEPWKIEESGSISGYQNWTEVLRIPIGNMPTLVNAIVRITVVGIDQKIAAPWVTHAYGNRYIDERDWMTLASVGEDVVLSLRTQGPGTFFWSAEVSGSPPS